MKSSTSWKKEARKSLKKNYWRIVVVSLLVTLLTGGLQTTMPGRSHTYQINQEILVEKKMTNATILTDFLSHTPFQKGLDFSIQNTPKQAKGFLNTLFNNITASGSFIFGFLNSINTMILKNKIGSGSIIAIGAFLAFLFWIFVHNVLLVGKKRFYLENRVYAKTHFHSVFLPYRVKKTRNTAYIMFIKNIKLFLWSFTILGGLIKRYSYWMIPYILAENPSIPCKEAFRLSNEMMKNRKWDFFQLDLSFIGWYVIDILTFGLLHHFYIYPYRDATFANAYMDIRNETKNLYPEGKYLCDLYLDVSNNHSEYPMNQYFLPEINSRQWMLIDYHCSYSFQTYILLFFTFSFIGWLWEVGLTLFKSGVFVNRGVLHGPWLPIYGTGGVVLLFVLKQVRDNPIFTFISSLGICGIIEYVTAWYLETFKQAKWWDYTGYFLNIHGRVCLEGLIVFGIGGCAFIYVLAPILNNLYKKISSRSKTIFCILFVIIFAIDFMYSHFYPNIGTGITESIAYCFNANLCEPFFLLNRNRY